MSSRKSSLWIRQLLQCTSLVIFISGNVFSKNETFSCHDHVALGIPANADQYLCRDGYAVGYNYANKNPAWVAYHISSKSVAKAVRRSNNFREDKDLPEQYRAELSDYHTSGYDRGHMAPAATVSFSHNAMEQSFLLSNMTPQLPGFNEAGWKSLESTVRDWATKYGELYVVSGPIYYTTPPANVIGNGVAIPDAFFKVVYAPQTKNSIAFITPHHDIHKSDLLNTVHTVNYVESITGMDFNPLLEASIQAQSESVQWQWGDW